jgi:hypothetical protein
VIVEWFYSLAVSFVEWLSSDVLTWDGVEPVNVWGTMSGFVTQFASLGVFVNWGALAAAVGLSIAVWLACLGIKALRAFAAHIPQVGGAG